jgi:V8-like Glu-specific endopeptidase
MTMTVKLSQEDFQGFVQLISSLDQWEMETNRWRLINDILQGVDNADRIRGGIDVHGRPHGSAVSLLTTFQRFGQPTAGKELIGILANKLIEGYVFDPEPVGFLRSLFEKYPLDVAVAPQPRVTDWRGTENPADVTEKIIGENTLRDVMLLELALEAAQSVVRIRTGNNLGTGFLCGENIIMTNNHVIPSLDVAKQSQFAFFYELDRQQREKQTQVISSADTPLFFTDAALDVTVIQIADVPEGVQPLALKRTRVQKDRRVSIIQHPGGHYKKISMQNNFVEYADTSVIQYTTSTEPGSSGSPVFDDHFNVIGIHHSGGNLPEPTTGRRYLRNAGSSMIAVLNAVQSNAPEIYSKLNIK